MTFEMKTHRDHFEVERQAYLDSIQLPFQAPMVHDLWLKEIHQAMLTMAPEICVPNPLELMHSSDSEKFATKAEFNRMGDAFQNLYKLNTSGMSTSTLETHLITFARTITEVSDEMIEYNAGDDGQHSKDLHYEWFEDLYEFLTDCGLKEESNGSAPARFTPTFENEVNSTFRRMFA